MEVNIEVSESNDATVAFLRQLKSSPGARSLPSLRSLRLALIRFCIQFDIEVDDGVIALREVRRWET